jgi:hypothetical protein
LLKCNFFLADQNAIKKDKKKNQQVQKKKKQQNDYQKPIKKQNSSITPSTKTSEKIQNSSHLNSTSTILNRIIPPIAKIKSKQLLSPKKHISNYLTDIVQMVIKKELLKAINHNK